MNYSQFWTDKFYISKKTSTLFYYIGLTQRLSVNSRKKRFVNPMQIEVIRIARMETLFGKFHAIFNGHQPPRAVNPYRVNIDLLQTAADLFPFYSYDISNSLLSNSKILSV